MNKPRAIVTGYYGKGNAGDEALLLSLLQMLPQSITPIVLSANPSATTACYGVESIPRRSLIPLLQSFASADLFIWGGGSLLQDVTSFASPFYYLGLMTLAQQLGLQTFAWSQGIGPIRARITQQLTRSILNNCTKVSVRDNASAQLLDNWAIPYLIAPDPVWSLESFPIQQVSQIKSPKVAVNLRPSPNLTSQGLFNLTKALGDFQEATNAALIFLPFQVEQDLPLIKQVAAELSGNYHILCLDDPRNLKGVFRDVEMLIGMRYHSLVMAAAEGCRCFALSYDPKVTQLQQELNIPGWQLLELPDHPELISSTWLNEYFHGDALNYEQIQSLIERSRLHQRLFAN